MRPRPARCRHGVASVVLVAATAVGVALGAGSAAASPPGAAVGGVVGAVTPRDLAVDVDAPVYDADAPDPDITEVGSTYYVYTTGSDLRNIQVLESTDLQHWQLVGDALPTLPAWSTWGETWAPGVVVLGGQYVMYYATEVAATGDECISVALSSVPAGPFVDSSTGPLVCQTSLGGSIDPQPSVDADGVPYLYWKSNNGDASTPADIWAAPLLPDGQGLASAPVAVLTQDQPWESTVESPAMVDASGSYVLFYSGGLWDSAGYGVGYAECAGPLGPCTKPLASPVLHSDPHRLGPGGESLVQDASGNWWMAYDAWDGPASAYSYTSGDYRSLWIAPVSFAGGTPTIAAGEAPEGYRLAGGDGGTFSFGAAPFEGSMGGRRLAAPVVAVAADGGGAGGGAAAGDGYWEEGADGGIFAFGDAPYLGSMGGRRLAAPMVGMAPTPDGGGYWLVGADGGVFAFGDAGFFGSMGGRALSAPIVGLAATPDGRGYWLVGADGGIFAFGDAPFEGSMGGRRLGAPVVGMAAMPQGGGYWLAGSDGGVFAFGAAQYFGSMGGRRLGAPVVAIAAGPGSGGYWLVGADGGIFAFGDAQFLGSMGTTRLAAPIVGDAAG